MAASRRSGGRLQHANRSATGGAPLAAEARGEAVARARRAVAALLPSGRTELGTIAASLGMTARTLQRRLRGQGTSYAELVADVRFHEALRLLAEPWRKAGDIATTLGYTDAAHFTRAFRRWTGLAPRDFRRRVGPAGSGGGHTQGDVVRRRRSLGPAMLLALALIGAARVIAQDGCPGRCANWRNDCKAACAQAPVPDQCRQNCDRWYQDCIASCGS